MSIYDQYIGYHNKYLKLYGEKTIVLCQVGSFFELYLNNKLYLSEDVYNTDLINVYYNCINQVPVIKDTIDCEIAHSRRDILCTLINSELKKNDKNKNQLFEEISKINNIFTLDDILLTDALAYMIKQDYIIMEGDMYKKVYY